MTDRKPSPHSPTPQPAPPARFRQTRTARLARARLARHLQGFGDDRALWWKVQDAVPEAWATVEEDIDCEEPKVKITLRLDASVARLFRAMGPGYQARINLILATYAQMQMAEVARERRGMLDLIDEFGVVQSEEARQAYLALREAGGAFDANARAKLDAAFGTKGL
jgi:uncharacterized protein (DUF4415 family)